MSCNFWPAPMDGVFTESFIRAVNELALTRVWMTSFFRLSETLPKQKVFRTFLEPYMESGVPVCAQLMGRSPELLARGAELLLMSGSSGINLNFGCPAPRVLKGGCGGAMLKEIPLMMQIVSAVKERIGTEELSVKLRSGFERADEMEQIIPALKNAGADKFFFHYRTVRELYGNVPDRHERFQKLMTLAAPVPVILNGDFGGVEETRRAVDSYNCAGIMLGRKFLSDPGVLRRLDNLSDRSREAFYYALLRNGASGEALKGLKRWIFGSWNCEVPPERGENGK